MNRSLWQDTCEMPRFPSLDGNKRTDILIVGGGIAGILTAYFLHQRNVPYILVEKNRICSGTTGNTTAKITLSNGLIYSKIMKKYGNEIAQIYLRGNKAALCNFGELCKDIDCDYEIKDNYIYSVDDRRKLEGELRALEKLGYRAKMCEEPTITLKTVGAVMCEEQAQINPLKLLSAISKDLNIYENTWVKDIEGKRAITDRGYIDARKIVIATHFPFIDGIGGYYLKMYQHRSYEIAIKNASDVRGMYVDDDKAGMSFRNYKDYLLLGGGGHRTGKSGGGWHELREFTKLHYPKSREEYYWAAQDCMTLDSLPYVGEYAPSVVGLYVATGFNKWGMNGSMMAAMILSDILCEKENELASALYPARSILHPQLLINGIETTANFLRPTAPRCTHLGCALKWNKAEKSWDCACHGSRFSKDGEVIDNPANKNMRKINQKSDF